MGQPPIEARGAGASALMKMSSAVVVVGVGQRSDDVGFAGPVAPIWPI